MNAKTLESNKRALTLRDEFEKEFGVDLTLSASRDDNQEIEGYTLTLDQMRHLVLQVQGQRAVASAPPFKTKTCKGKAAARALAVMVSNSYTATYLSHHDPDSLEQGKKALEPFGYPGPLTDLLREP